MAGVALEPALVRAGEHLLELDHALARETLERPAQRRALEVDVARLALQRRAGEDPPREPALARPGGEVAGQLAGGRGPVLPAHDEAPDLRPLRERAHRRLRAALRVVADRLDAAGLLRAGPQEAADSLYAIANEDTYLRMTEGAGLSPERYAGWLTSTLEAILLSGPAPL